MKTKSKKTKRFSYYDMIRWARFVSHSNKNNYIEGMFRSWYDGPPESKRGYTSWE